MIIVSDASPLSNLAQIGRLDLLKELFSRIVIPDAVADELRVGEERGDHPPFLGLLSWIETRGVNDRNAVDLLLGQIDPGEAEAIVLAQELGVRLLLVDEKVGRRVANQRGLRTTGILGVLLSAKEKGLIPQVKPILDELVDRAGFWVGDHLYWGVLGLAGEAASEHQ